MTPIATERLTLRRMAETDLHDFLAYQTHAECLRYQPVEPQTEETAARFLSWMATVEIGTEGGYLVFAVTLKSEARMIGEVSINILTPQGKGEIGWSFHPDYHGQGYATEAARALLAYGFGELKLHRITSVCDTRNTASFRLMERLGMRREGHLRQSQLTHGRWHDEYLYALLRDEWFSRRDAAGVQSPHGPV